MPAEAEEYLSEDGCIYAAKVLGVWDTSCSECCPFPFCVEEELERMTTHVRSENRKLMAAAMHQVGLSIASIAKEMDANLRTVQRYVESINHKDVKCWWCSLAHSPCVWCKSSVYTVSLDRGKFFIVLNRHGEAVQHERKAIENFAEYVFPSGAIQYGNGGHDHWEVSQLQIEDVKRFEGMCAALNTFLLQKKELVGRRV